MARRVIIILLIVAVAVGGYFAYQYYAGNAAAANGALSGSGTIETNQIAITPQTSGRIIAAPPNAGVPVKTGEVLYRLDPATANLQVQQAQAGQRAAEANYSHVKDDSSSTWADRQTAKAQLDQAVVAVNLAKVQQGYTIIKSPMAGTLSDVIANVGENAVPGNNMAIIIDPLDLTVNIYIPENRIGEVHVGQAGTLTTDSTTKPYDCKVTFISSQAAFTPTAIESKDQRVKLVYQVTLHVTNPDSALKAGMPADVVLK
jgi:HlyD family secretion protein